MEYSDYCKLYGYRSVSLIQFSKRVQEMEFELIRKAEGRYIGIYVPNFHGRQPKLFNFVGISASEDIVSENAEMSSYNINQKNN